MKRIALVGMPNVGKTALFNSLTGSFQKVANFPGVTVEQKSAGLLGHSTIEVVDLPGLYSLDIATLDEKVTRDFLTGKAPGKSADSFVLVVDTTHIQKSFYLLLQLLELGHRPILALTQMDISEKRGLKLDLAKLEELSGWKVFPVSAVTRSGIPDLVNAMASSTEMKGAVVLPANHQKAIKDPSYVTAKFRQIDDWVKQITLHSIRPDTLTARMDRWVLHPLWGFVLLGIVLLLMFQALFSWTTPLQDGIEFLVGALGNFASAIIPWPILRRKNLKKTLP